MSSFGEQVAGAEAQSRGIKIKEDGRFLAELGEIRLQDSRQGLGKLFVVEYTILEGSEANPPGSKRSWVQQLLRKTDPGNIKAFMAALEGQDPDLMTLPPEHYDRVVEDEQIYRGRMLTLTTEMIVTQQNRDFCIHTWEHYDGERPADAPPPTPAAPGAPAAPTAPAAPAALTKKTWLAGAGPGTQHPTNPSYEWHPDHSDWGVRPKA
jgi:hypothetical protein